MELKTYLYVKGLSTTKFAKQMGISREYLSAIMNYRRKPSRLLTERFEKITEGHVKWEDLKEPPK